jgi:hypothetical protein
MILSLLFFAGCSKVTKENYDKLKIGMDYGKVITILGEADDCSSALGTKSCIWGNDAKNIKIKFVAGKLIFFSKEGL